MTGRERILAALAHRPVDRLPVWMMRQAGRYLPGYQRLRREHSFMEMVESVDLSTEISLEPVEALGVDASIVFHDILVPFKLMGLGLEFIEGRGPVIEPAIRTPEDVDRLHDIRAPESLVLVAVLRRLRERLAERCAVLGFAGAPFTMATYALDGGSSRTRAKAHELLRSDPALAQRLIGRLTPVIVDYLAAQAQHADALQIFESHADMLPRDDYAALGLPALRDVVNGVRRRCPRTPLILFALGSSGVVDLYRDLDVDAYSIDAGMPLGRAAQALTRPGRRPALQGNFDPASLTGTPADVRADAARFLRGSCDDLGHPTGAGLPTGWIVNLGHGVRPETRPESALAFVEAVHAFTNS